MITILGPTASGKTHLAVQLAHQIQGEIISADSRQVYQGMDIGTGKDLTEYEIDGTKIPYHLIDILPAGAEYNIFEFQQDFLKIHKQIASERMILCGGTGMYLEAILKGYRLLKVPINEAFHEEKGKLSILKLLQELNEVKQTHNTTDSIDKNRIVRALEIAIYEQEHQELIHSFPKIENTTFGILVEREKLKNKITKRLYERLDEGMIKEVSDLLDQGVDRTQLELYGLEYKFISQFLHQELSLEEMTHKLMIAIHQFSKRQMTWFRRMEKKGMKINWLDEQLSTEEKIKQIQKIINL
ncbi:MAG: tRNA (adenosine(37)-N6)-dimethylallyltransferase MiaA [Cytophagales bacterium]|nr:tRNA (adenosine(37)-N6)-dimethylallyltransferase MiaA [Cytophagales bacterium]